MELILLVPMKFAKDIREFDLFQTLLSLISKDQKITRFVKRK